MKNVRDADIFTVATIQVILTAARVLLLARGYRETSLDDIAQAAQMLPETVSRYFDSQEHVYAAVLRADLCALLRLIQGSHCDDAGPLDRLLAAHRVTAAFVSDYHHLEGFHMLTDAILSCGAPQQPCPLLRRGGAEKAAQIVTHFQRILDDGMACGAFRPMEGRQAALLQLSMCFGCARLTTSIQIETLHEIIADGVRNRSDF